MSQSKKYKICVYAISRNEEKFVDRWYESIKNADYICVLDTGSTDNTIEKLKSHGINVQSKIITPWRFDTARNESLKLIPNDADICICLDLDEVLAPNWKKVLLSNWTDDTTRIKYTYNWSLDENNNPIISFYTNKIHKNKFYKWTHPVHEVLTIKNNVEENELLVDELIINHYPDQNKSRSSYLPLLELSVKEDPYDDRNMHYLGREYMFYGKWNECIETLLKHLKLKNATWKDERAASMRFIARSYRNLGRTEEAIFWYEKAITEAPYLKEGYCELMMLYYDLKKYSQAINYGIMALQINKNTKSYINETFSNNENIYDVLSLCFFYQNLKNVGIKFLELAIEENPKNKRLQENKKYFE